jgi:hypothetical protein
MPLKCGKTPKKGGRNYIENCKKPYTEGCKEDLDDWGKGH